MTLRLLAGRNVGHSRSIDAFVLQFRDLCVAPGDRFFKMDNTAFPLLVRDTL